MSPHWIREPFNSTAAFIYSPFPCAQCTGSRAAGSCSGSPRSGWAVPVGSSHFQRSGLPKEMIACSLYHLPGLSWRAPYPSGHSTKWKLVWCFHQARREEGKLESHPPHPSPFSPSLCPVLQHFLNKSCTTSPMEIIPLREDGIHSFRVSNVSGSSSFSPQPALESLERSLGKWPMSEVISPSPQPWVWEVINSLEIWFSSAQPKRQKKSHAGVLLEKKSVGMKKWPVRVLLVLPRGKVAASDVVNSCQPCSLWFTCCRYPGPVLMATSMALIHLVMKGTGRGKRRGMKSCAYIARGAFFVLLCKFGHWRVCWEESCQVCS